MPPKSIILIFSVCVLSSAATAAPRYKYAGGKIVEISGLFSDSLCHPWRVRGTVIKRDFESDGLHLKGFVVENREGARDYVNIELPDPSTVGPSDAIAINQGLQVLLKEGRAIEGVALACGAAGRVSTLQSVR